MSSLTNGRPSGPPAHSGKARTVMLIAAIFVGLGSGSNYVYSGYAPQLQSKLGISSTQANLVGLGGNLGVYLAGPVWGHIVDRRGPKIPLTVGCICTFIGYMTVRAFYVGTLAIRDDPDGPVSPHRLALLIFFQFMTGAAGSGGNTASVNSVAKSFPERTRASATGAVLAGFGLSAFMFSMLSHVICHGEAGGFLLILAVGTSLALLVGSILVRPYPPAEQDEFIARDGVMIDDEEECTLARQVTLSDGLVLPHDDNHAYHDLEMSRSNSGNGVATRPNEGDDIESRPSDPLLPLEGHSSSRPRADSITSLPPTMIHMSPSEMFTTVDFAYIFTILAILCGIGLQWINNVGAVTLALARDGWDYDSREVAALQASQVATISLLNCTGRILAGAVSDYTKLRHGIQRVWFLPIVALLFLGSEVAAIDTTDVKHLWLVSAALGLAYGCLFNVMPMLVLEWFGMTHFSQNWGFVSMAPIVGGNLFNMIFGRVYDSNTSTGGSATEPTMVAAAAAASAGQHIGTDVPASAIGVLSFFGRSLNLRIETTTPTTSPADSHANFASAAPARECLAGPACFASAFRISVVGCIMALVLSIFAGLRRERVSPERRRKL